MHKKKTKWKIIAFFELERILRSHELKVYGSSNSDVICSLKFLFAISFCLQKLTSKPLAKKGWTNWLESRKRLICELNCKLDAIPKRRIQNRPFHTIFHTMKNGLSARFWVLALLFLLFESENDLKMSFNYFQTTEHVRLR